MTRPVVRELLILLVATVVADARAAVCRAFPSTCRHGVEVGR